MLVLDRRVGERLLIGEEIELEVIDLKRGRIRLGIEAPEAVAIHRAEVIEQRNAKESSGESQE
ncbi:carbon storage regulator [Halorhodospira sp. 9622]|uniref:carbon storage regulator n=1 Tax=Halorhodospira sp. 9622 TaxID=2899136 RepID=UPI001EE810F1|nr:carbon storage regulator [Halorhodospira sp. 9622]MCG5539495.1 carbon storage regulator [Halorhodospira sp. 9622]